MDRLDRNVFKHFTEMADLFEKVLADADTVLKNAVPNSIRTRLAIADLKVAAYKHSPLMLDVARHYLQAIQMRELALRRGNFTWYCAATYALCQDWGEVVQAVRWHAWEGKAVGGDIHLKAITVVVAAHGHLTKDQTIDVAKNLLSSSEEEARAFLLKALKLGLLFWNKSAERFMKGPKAPKPKP